MTDTITSQNIDLSSWDTLYLRVHLWYFWSPEWSIFRWHTAFSSLESIPSGQIIYVVLSSSKAMRIICARRVLGVSSTRCMNAFSTSSLSHKHRYDITERL